jgi:hypothetical protein
MKTKLQRLKSCRPSPGHLEIVAWIRSQQVRLGIPTNGGDSPNLVVAGDDGTFRHVPTVTVLLPQHGRRHARGSCRG